MQYILMVVYQPANILHVLDLIKFTKKSSEVIHHTFEYCGYKDTMHDLNVFCSLEGLDDEKEWKKCSASKIMTNLWWRQLVLYSHAGRIMYNIGLIIYYALEKEKTGQIMAAVYTGSTLYDMGEDFGTVARYSLDFNQVKSIEITDYD